MGGRPAQPEQPAERRRRLFPPSVQWIGRTAYLFPLQNMVLWGMGPALGLAAWGGFLYVLWRTVFRREASHLLPAFWVAIYFLFMGRQFSLYMRYFLPMYAPLALFAAYLLFDVWKAAQEGQLRPAGRPLAQSQARPGAQPPRWPWSLSSPSPSSGVWPTPASTRRPRHPRRGQPLGQPERPSWLRLRHGGMGRRPCHWVCRAATATAS